jgi:hypothetical protein
VSGRFEIEAVRLVEGPAHGLGVALCLRPGSQGREHRTVAEGGDALGPGPPNSRFGPICLH